MIVLTDNLTTVDLANLGDDDLIGSIALRTQAGQVSENAYFRIGNDDPYQPETDLYVYTTDPNLSLSIDSARGFGPALSQTIQPGKIGSTIFVRLTADLDATEGDRRSQIIVGDTVLDVDYFVAGADQGDTEFPPMERLAGDDTDSVLEQIEQQGEALVLVRYDPLPKPTPIPKGQLTTYQGFRNQNIAEWCNPNNAQVGYRKTTYHVKGFVGDRDLLQNMQYSSPVALAYGDAEQIILPANFEGFDPTAYHSIEFFSQLTPTQRAYQQTQWTVLRHDGEYALVNIRKQKYYRGQLLFFAADLQRVNYPGASSGQGFLPWSQLYDEDGKVIDYVPGFSRDEVDEEYCEYGGSDELNPSLSPPDEPEAETAPAPISANIDSILFTFVATVTFDAPLQPGSITADNWRIYTGSTRHTPTTVVADGTTVVATAPSTPAFSIETDPKVTYSADTPDLYGANGLVVEAFEQQAT